VRKVGFTGSTEVGKLLMEQCSKQLKKISLELGGNAPAMSCEETFGPVAGIARFRSEEEAVCAMAGLDP